jgi:radical SAM enzyme (TIGR01210 family)
MSKLDGESGPVSVKLYTSGSFLDPGEVPVPARAAILDMLANDSRVREVVLESRPEYVSQDVVVELRKSLRDTEIELGIGLESSNDLIRSICINKGFSREDFSHAVEIARSQDIGVRAYVLLKPPFLTERDALLDATQTIQDAAAMGVTTISLNPVNVQRYTLVERLWSRGEYRPPWLWTVLEVLKRSSDSVGASLRIVCDPVAAGKLRGTHNCGVCDESVSQAIGKFSLVQDASVLEGPNCGCLSVWHHVLEHEDSSLMVHDHTITGK